MRRLMAMVALAAATILVPSALWALDFPKSLPLPNPSELPKPTAKLTRFQLESLTLRDVTFLFEVEVHNPYPLPLDVSGMNLVFSVEGDKALELATQGGFSVPASGSKSNSFTAKLRFEDLFKIVKDYAEKDWLLTKIDGTLVIPLPELPGMSGLPKSVSFSYELQKRIPAIKPTVSVVDFKVEAPSSEQVGKALAESGRTSSPAATRRAFLDLLAGRNPARGVVDPSELDVPLAVSFTIELANDSKASLAFTRLCYDFYLNGEKLVSGDTTRIEREGPRTFLRVRSVFSSTKLSEGVRRIFSDRSGLFRVVGNTLVKLPDEIQSEPLPLTFDEGGNFHM